MSDASDAVYILPDHLRPIWLEYPYGYLALIDYGINRIFLWYLMTANESVRRAPDLRERYPERTLFPFAYHQGCDDIACWSAGGGEKVTIIHDFASPGWEFVAEFETTGDWLRYLAEEFIDWEPIPDPKT